MRLLHGLKIEPLSVPCSTWQLAKWWLCESETPEESDPTAPDIAEMLTDANANRTTARMAKNFITES
jgi:hypothetical protein